MREEERKRERRKKSVRERERGGGITGRQKPLWKTPAHVNVTRSKR